MKYKLEQDRLNFEREQKEREEKIRQEEAAIKRKQAEFAALEGKLGKVLPMVNEAILSLKNSSVISNSKSTSSKICHQIAQAWPKQELKSSSESTTKKMDGTTCGTKTSSTVA
jgi:beta-phosphoglucomutase-like phosphatase (HAD superfamily)